MNLEDEIFPYRGGANKMVASIRGWTRFIPNSLSGDQDISISGGQGERASSNHPSRRVRCFYTFRITGVYNAKEDGGRPRLRYMDRLPARFLYWGGIVEGYL